MGLTHFLKRNVDLFAWTAADMPGIDPKFSNHKLSVLLRSKPIAQRLRHMSPKKAEKVKKQVIVVEESKPVVRLTTGKKCKRKLGKQENRGTEKTELQEQNRALTHRRHYPRLGVAELASILSPILHSTPRRDARRLGVNGAARKLALHQGLDA
ncbi:hypothetical protein PIB30_102481 [Stylosanthes scabra]|uniref:Uncharacterized protein n=1 Tax=Stylosanthes scabra TaxID=79078 RepID=A0ABU6VYZ4_9FABA|nr:hypothetical protein [Stylosanthes scabra]